MNTPDISRNPEQYSALLYEASKLLGAPVGLKSALDALLTGIMHRYALGTCLFLTDSGDGFLRVEFSLGVSSVFAQSLQVPKGEGTIGVVYASALARQIQSPKEAGRRSPAAPCFNARGSRRLSSCRSKPKGA